MLEKCHVHVHLIMVMAVFALCVSFREAVALDGKLAKEYAKNPFEFEPSSIIDDIMTGAGYGATLGVFGGEHGVIVMTALGGIVGGIIVIKNLVLHEFCSGKLMSCECKTVTCILNPNEENNDLLKCCEANYEWTCYCDWELDIIPLLLKRFPEIEEDIKFKKQQQQSFHDTAFMLEEIKKKKICAPETECQHCGGVFGCIPDEHWWQSEENGCCPPTQKAVCCLTTSTTSTTSTTTTTPTTTTTDEFLRCKKARFESHPVRDIYKEDKDKACQPNEHHCYVLNCTTVSSSIDGFIGFTAEWGCSLTKDSFLKNNTAWSESECNYFVGKKFDDMSNHDKDAVISNPKITTQWCKGGLFWKKYDGNNITICKPNEQYCYVANCSIAMAGASKNSLEFNVLTKWGCTDKAPEEFQLDPEQLIINSNESKQIIRKECSYKLGKIGVLMANAAIKLPIPVRFCKKAYLSKLLTYYENSDNSCSQFQRYCYMLNCSTTNNELMTEWGCTDANYDTDDLIHGTGRALAQAYIGPIPQNSLCVSAVVSGSNNGLVLPTPSIENKCKIGRETLDNKTSTGDCPPDTDLCYLIECNDSTQPKKFIKEWGCTSNITIFPQFCTDKKAEFGYASNEHMCICKTKVARKSSSQEPIDI